MRLIRRHYAEPELAKRPPRSTPQPASLPAILELQKTAGNRATTGLIARMGTPQGKAAPSGISEIEARAAGGRGTRGLTLIPNAVAFTAPNLVINVSGRMTGTHTRLYSAVVAPTSAPDVVHESFYPLDGFHRIRVPPSNERAWGNLSHEVSDLIKAGEQEHLNDAQTAHALTYGCVANQINALAEQTAQTPCTSTVSMEDAQQKAERALARRLPAAFGDSVNQKLNPAKWSEMLDRMLLMTKRRDTSGWHWIKEDLTDQRRGNLDVYDLVPTDFAQIDSVTSSEVVHY